MNLTHNGKIGRQSKAIREQLNLAMFGAWIGCNFHSPSQAVGSFLCALSHNPRPSVFIRVHQWLKILSGFFRVNPPSKYESNPIKPDINSY